MDSVWWEQATCNESLVQGACIVSHMEATFTRLKPYTNYTFRVAARGLFGKSNYSIESKWVVTDEAGNFHVHNTCNPFIVNLVCSLINPLSPDIKMHPR